jgi:hypothetical protein
VSKRVRYRWDHFRFSWMIYYAIFLHGIWALMILASSDPFGSTPVHVLEIHPRIVTSLLLGGTAAMAVLGIRKRGTTAGWLLLLPQQILLMISAVGGIAAAVLGHYADGVARPNLFIAADQLPGIVAAVCHTFAIVDLHRMHRIVTVRSRPTTSRLKTKTKTR